MSSQWISIAIEADGDLAQAVCTSLLLNAGCKGVRVDEHQSPTSQALLTSYVPDDAPGRATVNAIQASLLMLPALGVDGVATPAIIGIVDEEDWATGWKKYFKPIRVGRHLIVTPPWEAPILGSDDLKIVIDPGMAFGTGTHPTTQLCLEALEEFVAVGSTVADIGTGSGILAIAASKLGAATVVATDNDPLAVRIAGENARVNNAAIHASDEFPGGLLFDVVVANIIVDTLIELHSELGLITKPGGMLILSGIIDARESDVADIYVGHGFQLLEERRSSEWVALICRRDVS